MARAPAVDDESIRIGESGRRIWPGIDVDAKATLRSKFLVVFTQAPAMAQTPTAMQKAEGCLRANAGVAVKLDKSLESAAGFLVNYFCGEQVETASRFQRNTDLIAVLEKPGAAAKISVDPETGRLRAPVEPGKSPTDGIGAVNVLQAGFVPSASPSLKALAGQLVLQARGPAAKTR